MSVEAISWALNLAPIPLDQGRLNKKTSEVGAAKASAACHAVLVGLANNAGSDGTGSFPGIRTLMRYTSLCERAVQNALRRLEEDGIIKPCDPAVIAAKIKRADRRPQGWDLAMELINLDLDDEDVANLERKTFPGITGRLAAARIAAGWTPRTGGVHHMHPEENSAGGVHVVHPEDATGCIASGNGVHVMRERGAPDAPEPSLEPSSLEPSLVCTDPPTASQYKPSTQPTAATTVASPAAACPDPGPPGELSLLAPDGPPGQRPALKAVDDDPQFAEFWEAYPRHVAKGMARKAWRSALKRAAAAEMIAGARRYADDPGRTPQYTKHPATWLNGDCWADEPSPAPAGGRGQPSNVWHDPGMGQDEHERLADLFEGVSVNGKRIE